MSLSKTELKLITKLLEEMSEEYGGHCCNDYGIKNSKEHKELLIEIVKWNVHGKIDQETQDMIDEITDHKGRTIDTTDFSLMDYLAYRCEEESK